MSSHRDARIFKHLKQLYQGRGRQPHWHEPVKRIVDGSEAGRRSWARAALDELIGRRPGRKR